MTDLTKTLRQIAGPNVPRDTLYRPLVVERTAERLGDAVRQALAVLDAEVPPPSTSELWDSALGEWERAGRRKTAVNGADLTYLVRRHFLLKLPSRLRKAFLVARCPKRGQGLDAGVRELLEWHLHLWITSQTRMGGGVLEFGQRLLRERKDLRGNEADPWTTSYQSPREKELWEVVNNSHRPEADRRDAAEQLSGIEWKRIEDSSKRWVEYDELSRPNEGGRRKRGEPYKFNPRKPCAKHGSRACSSCHPRRNRTTPTGSYVKLAREAGWDDAAALGAPFARGRLSANEKLRYETLKQIVWLLSTSGDYTQEAIGRAIGRDRKAVSKLLQDVNATSPDVVSEKEGDPPNGNQQRRPLRPAA